MRGRPQDLTIARGAGLKVDVKSAGKRGRCPKCQHLWVIPQSDQYQVAFPLQTNVKFPRICVGCLCANPPEVLNLDLGVEKMVGVGLEQGLGDKIGTVMGQGLLGGILGGFIGGTIGSMFDKGKIKIKRELQAIPVPVPICQRCRAVLSQEQVTALAARIAPGVSAQVVETRYFAREFSQGQVLLRFTSFSYAEAFRNLNSKLVFATVEESLKQSVEAEEIAKRSGRCPKCGLSFGWDGVRCTHCSYHP